MSAAVLAFVKRAWPQLLAGVVMCLVLWAAYAHGVSVTTDKYERQLADQRTANATALADALAEQARQSKANMDAALAIERAYHVQQMASQSFFNSLSEQVATYVEQTPSVRSCGLDADGLRLWTEANRGGGGSAHRAPAGHP